MLALIKTTSISVLEVIPFFPIVLCVPIGDITPEVIEMLQIRSTYIERAKLGNRHKKYVIFENESQSSPSFLHVTPRVSLSYK